MAESRSPVLTTPKHASKRLTWAGVRNSVYAAAGTGVRMVTVDAQYDLYRFDGDGDGNTWPAKGENAVRNSTPSEVRKFPEDPFSDTAYPIGKQEVPIAAAPAQAVEAEQPYHVFSRGQKWVLILIIGTAGLFSGLSSNIYFPALDQIATDLHVSLSSVDLTITSYLVIQGISPVILGSLSDTFGRRPIYIASFLVYIVANIGLSFSPNFAVLLIFRGLQSAGSASTVSIGNGVIQDISPPAERGAFISFYQAIRNFSIAVGPVLGGVLANFLGFRSIFIFLLILSALTLAMLVIFLPETSRRIAGNGSVRLRGIYAPLIQLVRKREPQYMRVLDSTMTQRPRLTLALFTDPLKLLLEKDILCSLAFGGVVYAIWSMVTASTTGNFKSVFGLSDLQVGLAFLPNGLGTIVGSTVAGKLMTRDFRAAEAAYRTQHDLSPDSSLPKHLPSDFPIEHARLKHLPWLTALFATSTASYGLSAAANPSLTPRQGWIAVPLTAQFFVAATSNAVFALNQTLVSDLCPGRGASSTAINNLVRCSLGAVGVAMVGMLTAAVGNGAAFVGLALLVVACTPLAVLSWCCGMAWRAERERRKELKGAVLK